jgi:hypothetical protein
VKALVLLPILATAACDPLSLGSLFDRAPQSGSVLSLLSTEDRSLSAGDEVRGSLSAADIVSIDGRYLEAWALEADVGETFSIDLISDDFDGYLYLVGPGLAEAMSDDDSGGACHARIDFTALESGLFHVVASVSSSSVGTYTLRVSEQPQERAAVSCGGIDGMRLTALPIEGRELRRGQPAAGTLTGAEATIENQRPVQAWAVRGRAGETLVVSLRSDAFDPYLYAFGPGMAEVATNDDGGSGLNSELTITFATDGTYVIGAAALSSGSTGTYTISVAEPMMLSDLSIDDRRIRAGSDAYGMLSDLDPTIEGRLVHAWGFRAEAGQRVTFELNSDDFDSYLQVVGPGLVNPLSDDDSAGDLDSRLTVTFPQNGTYRIVTGSVGGDARSDTLRAR